MPNALDPDRVTAEVRLDGAAEILAIGYLRMRAKKSANNTNDFGDITLDLTGHQSVHGSDTRQGGE